jgi:PAS domain S-box-containing protein
MSIDTADIIEDHPSSGDERESLLARVRAAEAHYTSLFQSASDAILVANAEAHYVDANPAATKLLGYTHDEFLQMRVPDIVASGAEWTEAEFARFKSTGRWDGELELRRKDGSLVTVEARAARVEGAGDGRYLSIMRDITERKRAEAHLLDEARLLETLHQIGTTLAAELELETLVQAVTDATTGVTGAEFGAFFYNRVDEQGESYRLFTLSGAPLEAFADYPMPHNTAIFDPTFRGEGIVRIDDVREDPRYGKHPPHYGIPKGHLPVRSYLAVPVISRRGEVVGGLFFGHSETGVFTERDERIVAGIASQAAIAIENARLYEEARQAVRLRDLFLSMASHELRTPVTVLQGYTDLLQRRARKKRDSNEREQRVVSLLHQQTVRLGKLIERLLDVSRIGLGEVDLARAPVDLCALLYQLTSEVQPTLERHTIHLNLTHDPVIVEGDVLRLEQVFQNLLGNAVKYSPNGGAIRVSLQATAGEALASITDEGIGIPTEALSHLFTRFYRARNAQSNNFSGLGLGLFVAREMVTQHGGALEVTSQEGRGSTFTVRLPLRQG